MHGYQIILLVLCKCMDTIAGRSHWIRSAAVHKAPKYGA